MVAAVTGCCNSYIFAEVDSLPKNASILSCDLQVELNSVDVSLRLFSYLFVPGQLHNNNSVDYTIPEEILHAVSALQHQTSAITHRNIHIFVTLAKY